MHANRDARGSWAWEGEEMGERWASALGPRKELKYLMDVSLWGCAPCSAPGRAPHNLCFLCESDAGASGTHPRPLPTPGRSHIPAWRSPPLPLPWAWLTIWTVSVAYLFTLCPPPWGPGICLVCCCIPGAWHRTRGLVQIGPQPDNSFTCQSFGWESASTSSHLNFVPFCSSQEEVASCKARAIAQYPHHQNYGAAKPVASVSPLHWQGRLQCSNRDPRVWEKREGRGCEMEAPSRGTQCLSCGLRASWLCGGSGTWAGEGPWPE